MFMVWNIKKRKQTSENKWGHCLPELGFNYWMLPFPSQGRNPFFLEPSVIITITDGNKLTHSSGVPDEVRAQMNTVVLPCTVCSKVICSDFVMTWIVRFVKLCKWWPMAVFTYKTPPHPCVSLPCLSSSCTCLWTLHWQAVSWPKSPFAGTSVCLHWC